MSNRDTSTIGREYTKIFFEKYYNNKLNSKFWSDFKFNEEVREKLLAIASDFYDHLNLDVPIIDIQLTGSLANYNYSSYSDLDVHIIIDFSKINKDTELVKKALDGSRFIWNLRHDIVIKDHDVELYVQDVNEQHTSSGLFSLQEDEWIRKPIYNPPDIDEKDVLVKYNYYVNEIDKMEKLIEIKGLIPEEYEAISKRAEKLKHKIQSNRKECLSKEGEFCVENLVFKKLRNNNYIEKLIDVANKAYDKVYSDK